MAPLWAARNDLYGRRLLASMAHVSRGPERGANTTLCTTNAAYLPAANCHRTNDQKAFAAKAHLPDLIFSHFGRTTFPYVVQWQVQAKLAFPSISLREHTGLPT